MPVNIESVNLKELDRKIDAAMCADRYRLRRALRNIQRAEEKGKPFDRNLQRLNDDLEKSLALSAKRQQATPELAFDESLPITARRDEIRDLIDQNQVVIVCGETGSGKSTQLPKICLSLGRGVSGVIGHTQPRRIAARSVAARLADELKRPLGREVGFKVRFTDQTNPTTLVKLMTDGVMLAETQHDRFLNQYDTIIIDEAHERSLNIDFLMGYIKRLLPSRPDLKLIITSATIDAERFAEHFSDTNQQPAPIVEVSGRTFPVDVLYRPLEAEDEDEEDLDQQQAIVAAVHELARIDRGDMLVFLPTERDIRETAKSLRGQSIPGDFEKTEIVPLYARLSAKDQNKVFQTHAHRRIVLATNVAESSLTVPGIRYVIDTGTARISRYSPRRKVQRLPIEAVSQASADQRKGRCGRIGPGVCIRLYSEGDFLGRDRYTTPEIRRTNLAAVILQTKSLKLGDVEDFPFLDPPKPENIRDGYRTLFELGALDQNRELTHIGRQLSRLPVDPRIGRMILAARDGDCLKEVLIIASALEIQDPRERPVDKQQAADECHAKFADEASDFLSYLKLWDFYSEQREKLSRNQLRKACRQNFLSHNRMREWQDVHRQLRQLVEDVLRNERRPNASRPGKSKTQAVQEQRSNEAKASSGTEPTKDLNEQERKEKYNAIHRALLTGLLSNVAYLTDKHEYTGAGGLKFHLWPGSGVFGQKPKWTVAAELVETTRSYARTVARINPDWIEPLANHLVKRSYNEPHWSRRQSAAMAYEKVTLFGLPVVTRRRTALGPVDPETARELFIRHGLVEGDFGGGRNQRKNSRFDFLMHNRQVIEQIESLAAKSRRNDLFVEEQKLFDFYNARIPEDVYDGSRFQRWFRKADCDLRISEADLLEEEVEEVATADFPDEYQVGSMQLPLEYRFEPGNAEDGITLVVPKAAINQLDSGRLGWLTPGLIEQKIVALIRSLPKAIRRNFVPAPDTARKSLEHLQFGTGSFLDSLCDALHKTCSERVTPRDFREEKLPPHLRMNVRVVDDEGAVVSRGRDLDELRAEFSEEASETFAELDDSDWKRDGITAWDFGELPKEVQLAHGGIAMTGYPSLIDKGKDVSLRLADSLEKAKTQTRAGIRRLFFLAEKRELESQVAWLPRLDKMKLHAATLLSSKALERQLAEMIADRAMFRNNKLPRDADQFQERRLEAVKNIAVAIQDVTKLADSLFEAYHRAKIAIEDASRSPRFEHVVYDVSNQLTKLTPSGFLGNTPWMWLRHYPRYLKAIVARFDKLSSAGLERDRQGLEELDPLLIRYQERLAEHEQRGIVDTELATFGWMLEEFRVSLFAQQLGTTVSVSTKRLEKQWAKVS